MINQWEFGYNCLTDDLIKLIEKNNKLAKKNRWYLLIISVSISIYLYSINVLEHINFSRDTFEVAQFHIMYCSILSVSIWAWITTFYFLFNDHISKNKKLIVGFNQEFLLLNNKLLSDEKRTDNESKFHYYLELILEFIFLRATGYLILYFSYTTVFHIINFNVFDLDIDKRGDNLFNTSLNLNIIVSFFVLGIVIEFLYFLKRNRYRNYLNEIKEIDKLNFEIRRKENLENLMK
jgi:hypothetical protein